MKIYFKKIIKENYLNMAKEIDMQVQEANYDVCIEAHSKAHHN